MSALKQEEVDEANTSRSSSKKNCEQPKARSLVSIFRRESNSSVGEVEGEANSESRSGFRRLSSVLFGEEQISTKSSGSSGVNRNPHCIFPVGRSRRPSFLLDSEVFDERENRQLVRCQNDSAMDPSCCVVPTRSPKCPGLLPCLIGLGAIIIIAVPLGKILGCMKRDISSIHHEMSDIKKQMGYVETEDPNSPVAKLSKECGAAIKYVVKEELNNFDADKTGKTDFALESAGGRIVRTINTENYGSSVGFLGLTLCEGSNGPRAMIQANTAPGECWAFKGSKGVALIKLLGKVRIDAISLEHISSRISPTGRLDTAPREFSVYGLTDSKNSKTLLGRFEYKKDSDLIQIFPIKSGCQGPFEYVELHIESNHGSPDYTCVYR
ncbi:hypothetical protein HHI36_013920 [Cryptolaemus montrouzieri]